MFGMQILQNEGRESPRFQPWDAETVNFMREVVEVEEGVRCDCCGKLITTPLWDMPIGGLCSECEQRLDETVYGKFNAPWQKVEQQKAERPVPWWYDI